MIDALDYERALLDCQAQCDNCGESGCSKENCPAYIVKCALRKQVPKKVDVEVFPDADEETGNEYTWKFDIRPSCANHIALKEYRFCPYCGQALER